MVSGGANSTIRIWDLHQLAADGPDDQTLAPVGVVARSPHTHAFGITQLSFYPFDADAFLSSSYDHHLKLYDTASLTVQASFDLDSVVYTHALSPIAQHLLVACATQHPAVRLVDLRTGASTHALPGHAGAVLSLAWSPTAEHVLASGGADGTVRVWDVRRSAGTLGVLDMDDAVGVGGRDGRGTAARPRGPGRAHTGAVNALTWTDDGHYMVSGGQDARVRVWDAATGANTLASFGPVLKNAHLATLPLLALPTAAAGARRLIYPNEHEILVLDLLEGTLEQRLRVPGPSVAAVRAARGAERSARNRVTSLAWRSAVDGFCSGHADGKVRVWRPRREEEPADNDEEVRKRKREVLDEVFRDLTKQKITFG